MSVLAQMLGFYVSFEVLQTAVLHIAVSASVRLVPGMLSHVTVKVVFPLTLVVTEGTVEAIRLPTEHVSRIWNLKESRVVRIEDFEQLRALGRIVKNYPGPLFYLCASLIFPHNWGEFGSFLEGETVRSCRAEVPPCLITLHLCSFAMKKVPDRLEVQDSRQTLLSWNHE